MVKRGSNGRFVGQEERACSFVKGFILLLITIPFLYYLLIRKNLIQMIMMILNKELGCDCSTTKTDNGW